jgi:putative DNA primase/helicase
LSQSWYRNLSVTTRTQENVEEFKELPKNERDNLKDIGAFVGGMLKGGNRSKDSVANRSFITLDIDYGNTKTLEVIKQKVQFAFTIYSTHSHAPKNPRYRLLIWPDRVMTADEYQPIARRMADKVGIEWFDDSSYESNRLFYWPSTPADGDYVFFHQDAPFLPVDKVLNAYGGDDAWKDVGLWPRSSRETKSFDRMLKKQANPLEKKNIIGAFCRTISMKTALDEHLEDVYRKESADRYTYIPGSTSKGMIIYDGKFAFSNHASDPCSGQCLNAFDLVRIHKFGHLDKHAPLDTPTHKLPSYREMTEWARDVEGVKADLVKHNMEVDASSFDDFELVDDGDDWVGKLQTTDKGDIKPTFLNAVLILKYDPELAGKTKFNEFSMKVENLAGVNWTSEDSYAVRVYVGNKYQVDFPEAKIEQAIENQAYRNKYHPVREYLEGLEWDGVHRIETLFIDYFGCEDNQYTREASQCFFSAAVHRIFEPGYKFDFAVVLGGAQGIGKDFFYQGISPCQMVWRAFIVRS